jgi:hypothetical protein
MAAAQKWVLEAIQSEVDEETGSVVEQLTSEPVTSNNISQEKRHTSADGNRVAIVRMPFGQPTEIWVCDLRTLKLWRAAVGVPQGGNAPKSCVYYRNGEDDQGRMMRLDMNDFSTREMFRLPDGVRPPTGAISFDEEWFVGGPFHVKDDIYSLVKVHIPTGKAETLCEVRDMSNPHLQFEPMGGTRTIVQVNRVGTVDRVTGKEYPGSRVGSMLCVADVVTGEVTPLPTGRPYTPMISGHECWVADTGEIIFSAAQYKVSKSSFVTYGVPPESEKEMPVAAIWGIKPGDKAARVVAQGLLWNHIGASDDGRFYIGDDHIAGAIYIGSMKTGKHLRLCESRTRQGQCQYSHVHPYMTPDNKHVIFNSIQTGVGQVYAATVPEGFLEKVLAL